MDFTGRKVVSIRDVQEAVAAGATRIVIAEKCVVTPSARDFLQQRNMALEASGNRKHAVAVPAAKANGGSSPGEACAESTAVFDAGSRRDQERDLRDGKKLWMRQFVDGNGGNISYRIGPNEVLCTPTLVSKYDLTPEDICAG